MITRLCKECDKEIYHRIKEGSSGLCRSCAFTGSRHPMYGKIHNRLTKYKMSIAKKGKYLGKDSPSWKGGRRLNDSGYVMIYMPNHPNRDKTTNYIREHRIVVEGYIGRYLLTTEDVHHIDGNKENNVIDNLMVFRSKSSHALYELGKDIDINDIIFDGSKL